MPRFLGNNRSDATKKAAGCARSVFPQLVIRSGVGGCDKSRIEMGCKESCVISLVAQSDTQLQYNIDIYIDRWINRYLSKKGEVN